MNPPKRRRRGRPTKRTPALTKEILEAISDGLPLTHAAALVGISYETFMQWRRDFPEFSESINRAIAQGMASHLKRIRESSDKGNTADSRWYLEHAFPEHFAKNRVEVAHKHEGTLKHSMGFDDATIQAIAEARQRYESDSNPE